MVASRAAKVRHGPARLRPEQCLNAEARVPPIRPHAEFAASSEDAHASVAARHEATR